jgi:hypothetical protein
MRRLRRGGDERIGHSGDHVLSVISGVNDDNHVTAGLGHQVGDQGPLGAR